MAKVYSTQQALDMILNQVNPCDSDGEEVTLDQSSDSEISSVHKASMGLPQQQTAALERAWRQNGPGVSYMTGK
ncbi:hypothetical protein MHYP_G00191730 [Metynnis hypsauchen]